MILDLQSLLDDLKEVLVKSMEDSKHIASGKGVESLEVVINGDDGSVIGNFYLPYLQTGSNGKPPYDVIHEWAKSRGIINDDSAESRKISGAITYTIRKKGTRAFQNGGEDIWNKNVDTFLKDNLEKYIKWMI